MHPVTQELQKFYDANAQHFSQTRKKHRYELDYMLDYIDKLPQKTVKILELGCGNGKVYEYIKANTKKTIQYTGIDISQKLLTIAQQKTTKDKFIQDDMLHFVQTGKQESIDIIICAAAFHHLPNKQERLIVLKNIYRLLKYEGYFIMTNRSRSQRFIQKYRRQILNTICKTIYTRGRKKRNDVYIPRKTPGGKKTGTRYYHIFTLLELEYLGKQSGFFIYTNSYITDRGSISENRKISSNIVSIFQKSITNYSSSSS